MTYFFRHGNSATSQRRQTTDLGWGCLRRSPTHDGLQRQVPRLECSWSARGAAQPLAGADLPLLPHSRVQAHPRARGARPLRPPRALLAAPPSTSRGKACSSCNHQSGEQAADQSPGFLSQLDCWKVGLILSLVPLTFYHQARSRTCCGKHREDNVRRNVKTEQGGSFEEFPQLDFDRRSKRRGKDAPS